MSVLRDQAERERRQAARESKRLDIPKQNGGDYEEPWHSKGCRALSLAAIAQVHTGVVLSASDVQAMFKRLSADPLVVRPDNAETGTREHHIINEAFVQCGYPNLRARQVGVRNQRGQGWQADAPHDYVIPEWPTSGTVGTHYTLEDAEGNELYDSWDGDDLITGEPHSRLLYRVWEA